MYLYLDSSAARGILSRRGVGRLRHLSCRILWLQDLVNERVLQVKAVLGTVNPADISTKRLSIGRLESLMFLCGVWCGSSSQLVGSSDPGGIFKHLPHQHHQSNPGRINSINMIFSALSLLAIHQLQGCSNSLGAMPEAQFFDVPTFFMTMWIGGLGAYVYWHLHPKPTRGTMDDKDEDTVLDETYSATDASEHTCNSDGESSSGSFDDYPAFSPEGMVSWMFERCNRRFERGHDGGKPGASSEVQLTSSFACRLPPVPHRCKRGTEGDGPGHAAHHR